MPRKEEWLTAANAVTMVRLMLVVPIVYGLGSRNPVWEWASLVLFIVAAASDGLDGYLARSRGEVTRLGQLLDPVGDKVLGIAVFLALVDRGLLPAWMLWTLVLKEGALLLGGALLLAGRREVTSARPLGKAATVVLFSGLVTVMAGLRFGPQIVGAGVIVSLVAGVDYARETYRKVVGSSS